MQLYTTPKSANGIKPLALVHHLGLDVDVIEVDVYSGAGRSPEYLAVNPMGKVPTLVDGDLVLWESNAILQYLADRSGRLWGADETERADVSRWLFFESSLWQPALTRILTPSVAVGLGLAPGPAGPVPWSDRGLSRLADVVEARLEGSDFLCGALSIADLSVAAMLVYGVPPRERIAAWAARVHALPAWREAVAGGPWA